MNTVFVGERKKFLIVNGKKAYFQSLISYENGNIFAILLRKFTCFGTEFR